MGYNQARMEEVPPARNRAETSETAVTGEASQLLLPTQPEERLALIDVLRGLALFGIIAANMRGFAGPLTSYFQTDWVWNSRTDFWVQSFIDAFVQGKFITLFAFLFGVGFAIQFTRAEKRHSKFIRTYSRRLVGLLLIGALHLVFFWWGDILVSYALGGFLLILFRKRQSKTVLIWALGLMLLPVVGASGYRLYGHLRPDPPQKAAEKQKESVENRKRSQADMWKTVKVYQAGGYAAIFKERLGELKREAIGLPRVIVYTVPIFLLGLWVWRLGVLQDPERHRSLLRKGLIVGAAVGIPANLAYAWVSRLVSSEAHSGPPTGMMIAGFALLIFGRPALSMSYGCGLGLLFLRAGWRRRLMPFGAIGRTALSNYLLQTIVCTTIFYGYGGGLFAKVDLAWLLLPTVVVYGLEVPLSNWWLAHYRFGPAEWAWRWMTYRQKPGMKRVPEPA
jgi:uncharacterized protein